MKVVYPGTFDGLHFGHLDIIERASRMFEEVIVAIGINEEKTPIFTVDERVQMIKKCTTHLPNVKVVSFEGMLDNFLWKNGIKTIVMAARNVEDFNSIKKRYDALWDSDGFYEAVTIVSSPHYRNISSSMVKAIEYHGGDISDYVPGYVKMKLERKISNRVFIGLTGLIGSGKNYISNLIIKLSDLYVTSIDFDRLTKNIHTKLIDPGYINARKEIIKQFGDIIHDKSDSKKIDYYFINTKKLAKIVFNSQRKLHILSDLLYEPTMHYFRDFIRENKLKGIIILNCAYLVENHLLDLCNNNVILVEADEDIRRKRVMIQRKMSEKEFNKRSKKQMPLEAKKKILEYLNKEQNGNQNGNLWTITNNNSVGIEEKDINKLVSCIEEFATKDLLQHEINESNKYFGENIYTY